MSYGAAPAGVLLVLGAGDVTPGAGVGLLLCDSVVVELSVDQPGALAGALVTGSAIDGAATMLARNTDKIVPENGRTRARLTLTATILT
jgi:hypothetical protein